MIDTDVLIDVERAGKSSDDLRAMTPSDVGLIASITASELLVGVLGANSPERRRRREAFVETLLSDLTVVPFDLVVARVYARVAHDLSASGQQIGAHDLMIAATALAHDVDPLTHNVREFSRVPGLIVLRPDW